VLSDAVDSIGAQRSRNIPRLKVRPIGSIRHSRINTILITFPRVGACGDGPADAVSGVLVPGSIAGSYHEQQCDRSAGCCGHGLAAFISMRAGRSELCGVGLHAAQTNKNKRFEESSVRDVWAPSVADVPRSSDRLGTLDGLTANQVMGAG
jgi:hypothetical protein